MKHQEQMTKKQAMSQPETKKYKITEIKNSQKQIL